MSSPSTSTIDLSSLSPAVAQRVLYELEWAQREEARNQRWRDLCDGGTDEQIIEAGRQEAGRVAVVLASTYEHVERWQEIVAWAAPRHPRRPVLMRGGVYGLIAAWGKSGHHSANGLAEAMMERYHRMARTTAFRYSDIEAIDRDLEKRLRQRFRLTGHFRGGHRIYREADGGAYLPVAGKWRYLGASEVANIEALHKIIQRTDKLEERKAAALAHMKARLAA